MRSLVTIRHIQSCCDAIGYIPYAVPHIPMTYLRDKFVPLNTLHLFAHSPITQHSSNYQFVLRT